MNRELSRPCFGAASVTNTWPVRQWIDPARCRFLFVPGVWTVACAALEHPHPADLRVGVDLDLVLPDGRLVGGQAFQELPQFGQLDPPLLLVRRRDRPGPAVDQVPPVEQAADGLAAGRHPLPLAEQEGQHRAGPAAAQEAEVGGGLGGHPGDEDGDPPEAHPKGAAALPAGQPGDPLGLEPLEPAVDGAGATEEHGLDRVPGVAVGQQEDDVGAEPELGVGVLAVDGQQFVALLGRQGSIAGAVRPWWWIGSVLSLNYTGPVTFPLVGSYLGLRWPNESTRLFQVTVAEVQVYRESLVGSGAAPKTLEPPDLVAV